MKKGTIILAVIGVVVLILLFASVGSYNGLVGKSEDVENNLGQIDTQLQRRNDLIPNLVETVKGYATHEKEALQNVTDARAKLAGAKSMSDISEADAELSNALSRLLVIVENYPDLKADANFRQLMDNLEGTENRIATARKDYNDSVRVYNTAIRRFPTSILAGLFNFEKADYFTADEGAKEVPKVEF